MFGVPSLLTILVMLWGCGGGGSVVRGGTGGVTAVALRPATPVPGDTLRCVLFGETQGAERGIRWTLDGESLDVKGATWTVDAAVGSVIGCAVRVRLDRSSAAATLRDQTTVREADPDWAGGNVLVMVADDLGVDKVSSYEAHPHPPPTPNLDRLAARGVSFDRVYSNPVCSPTRATILTGRHVRRTGVGRGIHPHNDRFELSTDELTLPELLGSAGYASAALGKWHLAGHPKNQRVLRHPQRSGFDTFRGSLSNLLEGNTLDGTEQGYTSWEKVVDGEAAWVDRYATTDSVDDALELASSLEEPWFIYLAFHAPHAPSHVPPKSLVPRKVSPGKVDRYDAMVEAMDAEIGRLVEGLGKRRARTNLLFVGDNGTPDWGVRPPADPDASKGSLREGGIHVPMIVSGPAVRQPGRRTDALVQTADIFATVAELAGVDLPETRPDGTPLRLDSLSVVPHLLQPDLDGLRDIAWTERFAPLGCPDDACEESGEVAISKRWKYLVPHDGKPVLFDLSNKEARVEDFDSTAREARAHLDALHDLMVADLVEDRTAGELTR